MESTTMSEAELTILSLLSESARYGHELQNLIEERGLREWVTIGFSSIFYLLNKLERQGMIRGELRPDSSGMARKFYHLTEAGRGVLQTAVADLLRQPHAFGTGFELGLANIGVLRPLQVYQTLSHHRADLRQRLETIQKSWERHQREEERPAEHIAALYTHSIAVMQAELEWLTRFLNEWAARYPEVERPPSQPTRNPEDTHKAATMLARRSTPDPAKLIQKLKRPPKSE